ncbi:hypothetical protein EI94DRAFT_1713924 [Lactarius quietus]|nr:hypothetical protein EI94DRAFT_1713924 [Lactarius quietus]
MLAGNTPQIQNLAAETVQQTDAQQAGLPAGGDTPHRFRCLDENCGVTFGRLQERKRHHIDVHNPRRQCPFCPYKWCRPNKIKTHLTVNHKDKLSPEVLNELSAKRGRHLVAFLVAHSVIP